MKDRITAIPLFIFLAFAIARIYFVYFRYLNKEEKKYLNSDFYKSTHISHEELRESLNKNKGEKSEYRFAEVVEKLKKHFGDDNIKLVSNMYVPKRNGTTTEIDCAVITPIGVFVTEVKERSGNVRGNENEDEWRQWFSNGKVDVFYNPIKQNDNHIRILKERFPDYKYYNVVYIDSYDTKIEYSNKRENLLISNSAPYIADMIKKKIQKVTEERSERILSSREINHLYHEFLIRYCNVSQEVKEKHVRDIQNDKSEQDFEYSYDSIPQEYIDADTLNWDLEEIDIDHMTPIWSKKFNMRITSENVHWYMRNR